jgi:hypothetical protein
MIANHSYNKTFRRSKWVNYSGSIYYPSVALLLNYRWFLCLSYYLTGGSLLDHGNLGQLITAASFIAK